MLAGITAFFYLQSYLLAKLPIWFIALFLPLFVSFEARDLPHWLLYSCCLEDFWRKKLAELPGVQHPLTGYLAQHSHERGGLEMVPSPSQLTVDSIEQSKSRST